MISMSKLELSNYLRYYAHLQDGYINRKKMSLSESFYWFTKANNDEDLYNNDFINTMIRAYDFYVNLRMYSIEEDFFLNRDNNISNDDLDSFVHNCKFYEKPNNITNKRILEIVRNSFNHSLDTDFKVSKNVKNFEIDIKDIRYPRQIANGGNPQGLHMRFNIKYINELNNLIAEKGRNTLYTAFDIPSDFNMFSKHLYTELDKIKFRHYYFDKKLDQQVMDRFKKLNTQILENNGVSQATQEATALADSINLPILYDLTHDQKITIINIIRKYKNKFYDLRPGGMRYFMDEILNYVTPVPGLKLPMLRNELMLQALETSNKHYSFYEIINESLNSLSDENSNDKLKTLYYMDKVSFLTYLLVHEELTHTPYMIYIDSVITNLCDEEFIEIDGKKYEVRGLRNSLVHARWYIGNNKVYFFDALPENKNDYNLRLVGCIDLDKLITWINNYLIEKNKQNNNKSYILKKE